MTLSSVYAPSALSASETEDRPGRPLPVISGRPRTAAHVRAEENSRLVWTVLARRFPFLSPGSDRQREAYTAGYVELLSAIDRFDAARGFTFATYAYRCIEGGILRHLRTERWQERLDTVSLETPLGEDGSGALADMIADAQAEKPGAALASSAGFEALLASLPARQAELLRLLYLEEKTPVEVAAMQGTSRQRVHQRERQALQAARKAMLRTELTTEWAAAGRKARQEAVARDTLRDARWQRLEASSRTAR